MNEHDCIILLVEDNEDDRILFERALRKLGYRGRVDEAHSVEAAKAMLLDGECPDIIVSDGFWYSHGAENLVCWLRERSHLKETPVIVFSSAISPEQRDGCLNCGANVVVEKGLMSDVPTGLRDALLLMPEHCRRWLQ